MKSLEDFLGEDDDDSTEISSLIIGIDYSYSRSTEFSRRSLPETEEILSILKVPHTTKNKQIHRGNISSITSFGEPRKISMTGKVLSGNTLMRTKPTRTSNPVFKNFNTFEENNL